MGSAKAGRLTAHQNLDAARGPVRRCVRVESFRTIPTGTAEFAAITPHELRLAARNHGMPLEALVSDVTPIGIHDVLIHCDVPSADAIAWRLEIDGAVEPAMSLSLDDLRRRLAVTSAVTFECAGDGRALLDRRPVSQP
jgi:sulfane dehydrogenase subunit SoxC